MLMPPPQHRGCVAVRDQDKIIPIGNGLTESEKSWLGVFIGEESRPMDFGSQLWDLLQENWNCLEAFTTNLLSFSTWKEYQSGGLCPFCGKFGVGQPDKISGHILDKYQAGEIAPDPEAVYHTHLPANKVISSENEKTDGLWIEWVYLIDPKTYSLEILKAVRIAGQHRVQSRFTSLMQDSYRYMSIAFCSLFNDEPNWEVIQQKGINSAKYYFDKYPSQTV